MAGRGKKLPRIQRPLEKKKKAAEPAEPAEPEKEEGAQEQGAGEEEPAKKNNKVVARAPEELFRKDSTFEGLGLANWLVQSCSKLGMSYPTHIQVMSIPPILAGKNIIGNSKTGSGKTACYCLPVLHNLSKDPFGIFALILTPVRELALQVAENARALGKAIGVSVVEVVGGRDANAQSLEINARRHIVVATPGRLSDLLMTEPSLEKAFKNLRMLVLDEADRLLSQSFENELPPIFNALPKTRQTLLFSATITRSIDKLRARLSSENKELIFVDANPGEESLANLTQEYVFVPSTVQMCYLHYLLLKHFPEDTCIIFTPSIRVCQVISTAFELLGFNVVGLHSLQTQDRRTFSLNKFRGGRATILVATDVASRGLDIPKVSVVINYSLPQDTDDYVHRSGRTARAGRPGLVVSLMTERDVQKVDRIENRIHTKLELRETDEEAAIKLLSKTGKAVQKAELLLSDAGFEDKVEEHMENAKTWGSQEKKKKTKRKKAAKEGEPDEAIDGEEEGEAPKGKKKRRAATKVVSVGEEKG